MRGKHGRKRQLEAFARMRREDVEVHRLLALAQRDADAWRGQTAWHMTVEDVRIGHELLGFDYAFNGDMRPD